MNNECLPSECSDELVITAMRTAQFSLAVVDLVKAGQVTDIVASQAIFEVGVAEDPRLVAYLWGLLLLLPGYYPLPSVRLLEIENGAYKMSDFAKQLVEDFDAYSTVSSPFHEDTAGLTPEMLESLNRLRSRSGGRTVDPRELEKLLKGLDELGSANEPALDDSSDKVS